MESTWAAYFATTLLTLTIIGLVALSRAANSYRTSRPSPSKALTTFATQGLTEPTLSIVVPCYNEEERLPGMLRETISYCQEVKRRCGDTTTACQPQQREELFADFEIIVVDDCSRDGTANVVHRFAADYPDAKIKLVQVVPNHGKGYAVRRGFFESSGDYVLMADGDNATDINDLSKLLKALRPQQSNPAAKRNDKNLPRIAIGSRAHLEEKAIANRTLFRTMLMKLFHLVVAVTYWCGSRGSRCRLRDTQCGFKLFDRRATEVLFLNNRLERWAFDVELLILAQRIGLSVVEIPVRWEEIPGSKMRLRGMIQMGLECFLMCFTYGFGLWPVHR